MNSFNSINILFISVLTVFLLSQEAAAQNRNPDLVFVEKDGVVAAEAELYFKQSKYNIRQWYLTTLQEQHVVGRDEDRPHAKGAGNQSYLEILPDTRVTHEDELIRGENFSNIPGEMAVLHYRIKINNPGRYYVWVRAFSTGTEDNGIHVGINGAWPESGERMQWCEGKHTWRWESKQRTHKVHCGEPYLIFLDIVEPGIHEITFSMREDGFEFDRFLLTQDKTYRPEGVGPEATLAEK